MDFLTAFDFSCRYSLAVLWRYRALVCVESTIIVLLLITSCSIAISTVLEINKSIKLLSFSRSRRNFVKELGFMTSSSGAMSKKYLKDISYLERSTTSTSDKLKIDFNNKYLTYESAISPGVHYLDNTSIPIPHIQML